MNYRWFMEKFRCKFDLLNFWKDNDGASSVEYAILVVAIAAVIVAIVYQVGRRTFNLFSGFNSSW